MTEHRADARHPEFPRLLGERSCLDFVNTIESPRDNLIEFLHGYADLVRWSAYAGLITPLVEDALLLAAEERPEEAAVAWRDSLALRAALQRIFAAVANDLAPLEGDLNVLQQTYLAGLLRARLVQPQGISGYDWAWEAGSDLALPLWLLAQSGVELLTEGDLARVKECGGPDGCGWLFYDTSKNGSRRWCSMSGCGSQAKMRRYHARRKARA